MVFIISVMRGTINNNKDKNTIILYNGIYVISEISKGGIIKS